MKKEETQLRNKIKKALQDSFPGKWFVIHGSPYQERGIPDIIGCYQGRFYGLEVKVPGKENTLSRYQANQIQDIRLHGKGYATMVTSVGQALEFVRSTR